MKLRVLAHAAALVLAVFIAYGGPAHAEDITSGDVILKSGYELGIQTGYGTGMRNYGGVGRVDNVVFMPSISVPLLRREIGPSVLKGVLQYQFEPVIGLMTSPSAKFDIGASLIGFKYNFTGLGSRISPHADFGFGVIYEPVDRRVQGTSFNFLLQTGLGVQYFVNDKTAVNVSYRYRHISNAGIKQPNSGINSNFVLVGMSFF